MGYEEKFCIVEKCNSIERDFDGLKLKWANLIAVIKMGKIHTGSLFEKKSDVYFYADDGETEVIKDKYGDRLGMASIDKVIEFLEERSKRGCGHIEHALGLLKGLDQSEWVGELAVLRYGY